MKPSRSLLRRALPLGALAVLIMTLFGAISVARAAGGATFRDDAGLFTSTGRARIQQAAQKAGYLVTIVTSNQSFPSRTAWRDWLRNNGGNASQVTIGLHRYPKQSDIYVIPGADTGITQAQADQGKQQALSTFNSRTSGATTDGVIRLIQIYQGDGATLPGGGTAPSNGTTQRLGIGSLILPLIILAVIGFVLVRVLGMRRGTASRSGYGQAPTGPGPYNQGGPQGPYGQGQYPGGNYPNYNQGPMNQNRGGGIGSSIVGGVAGGIAGSVIGNELFNHGGGGGNTANAAGVDPNVNGPSDTANAQDSQGGWDAGGSNTSSADAGGWGGGGDSGGGWGGGGGDSGGGWGGDGGDGGWS